MNSPATPPDIPTFADIAEQLVARGISTPVSVAQTVIDANVSRCPSCDSVPQAERIIRVARFAGLIAKFDLQKGIWTLQLSPAMA